MTVKAADPVAECPRIAAQEWLSAFHTEQGSVARRANQSLEFLTRSPWSITQQSFRHTIRSPSSYLARSPLRSASEWNGLQPPETPFASIYLDAAADNLDRLLDSRGWHIERLVERTKYIQQISQAYLVRIKTLRSHGELEGIIARTASERDFWHFVRAMSFIRKAQLILMDNGNLRAVWKSQDGSHLGLQLLGHERAEYVIFKRRPATKDISRVAGVDTLEGVARQIDAFDLTSLVNA